MTAEPEYGPPSDQELGIARRIHRRLPGRRWRSALIRPVREAIGRWSKRQPDRDGSDSTGASEIHGWLSGKSIGVLVADGFTDVELTEPVRALKRAGARTVVVSPAKGQVTGWSNGGWTDRVAVDVPLEDADPDGYDGLLLPGGVLNSAQLRCNPQAVGFVRTFFEAGKPVAAICYGLQTLIDAGVVSGRRLTSYK